MLRTSLLFWDGSLHVAVTEVHICRQEMPTVDWIRGKVGCTSVPIVRLLFTLVTRLMCDREALNSLMRVFVFSCVLACQIRVAREFQEVINKKHARVMRASVKLKLSGTVCKHTVRTYIAMLPQSNLFTKSSIC